MRLRRIKLAGFKSFVDPTTIGLPGDIVGVVGPNGCGKSNIIDAVRWVLGEISARHLRGGTMADVIFNGSGSRKPIGQAAVELIFDNADGRLAGRFSDYAEVAVRRQVSRDGQSSYFLNGTRCRRRDVMDLFLGTGLGPRSYAIIEQGMISRVIEGRPEELREFLEEAAGTSKYKERRRDTESRIHNARENLDRLRDLREELGKRLGHLERQAKAAERYKLLKAEERLLSAQLYALRWRELRDQSQAAQAAVREQETRHEAALAEQRATEARVEAKRSSHAAASETFNARYREVLDAGASVARIEETIRSLRRRHAELTEQHLRERAELTAARAQHAEQIGQLDTVREALAKDSPTLAALEASSRAARGVLTDAEESMQAWQNEIEALGRRAAEPGRTMHAERARIEQIDSHIARLGERLEQLTEQLDGLDPAALELEIDACEAAIQESEARLEARAGGVRDAQAEVRELRAAAHQAERTLHAARDASQAVSGRLASLQAVQQDALGKRSGQGGEWLAAHGLAERPRLAERIVVEPGWESAVETVLRGRLDAVCVEDLDIALEALGDFGAGCMSFYEQGREADRPEAERSGAKPPAGGAMLLDQVDAPGSLAPLLNGVRVAPDLAAAARQRAELALGESLVTPNGEWLGSNWLTAWRAADGDVDGILAREHALRELNAESSAGRAEVASLEASLEALLARSRDAEDRHAAAQGGVEEANREFAERRAALVAARTRLESVRTRAAALTRERNEVRARLAAEQRQRDESAQRLAASVTALEGVDRERAAWELQRDAHRQRLDAARGEWQRVRDEHYQCGLRLEGLRTRAAALEEGVAREAERVERLETRLAEMQRSLAQGDAPVVDARARLETQLAVQAERQQALDATREQVEALDSEVRALDARRQAQAREVQDQRAELERLRLAGEEVRVRRETVEERLTGDGFDPAELLGTLPDEAGETDWEERLAAVERRIARLGSINLAAIDERTQVAERKTYLDKQNEDLEEALATLEAAIHKIDRETRARFKETYEQVNTGLERTFPRLFGGGNAYLQLTGDDLLSTGVTIMARPPGKRNTSIQLLSGGEKALTAVALVFAIFDLNPAPFCLLDEVDAPLDDANVGRLGELLAEMSERVQFLVITHSKATMELAQQLIGVTMNEPGVSRLVAVDIEEAVEMAAV